MKKKIVDVNFHTCLSTGHQITTFQSNSQAVFLDRSGARVLAAKDVLKKRGRNILRGEFHNRLRNIVSTHLHVNVIVLQVKGTPIHYIFKVDSLLHMIFGVEEIIFHDFRWIHISMETKFVHTRETRLEGMVRMNGRLVIIKVRPATRSVARSTTGVKVVGSAMNSVMSTIIVMMGFGGVFPIVISRVVSTIAIIAITVTIIAARHIIP